MKRRKTGDRRQGDLTRAVCGSNHRLLDSNHTQGAYHLKMVNTSPQPISIGLNPQTQNLVLGTGIDSVAITEQVSTRGGE